MGLFSNTVMIRKCYSFFWSAELFSFLRTEWYLLNLRLLIGEFNYDGTQRKNLCIKVRFIKSKNPEAIREYWTTMVLILVK